MRGIVLLITLLAALTSCAQLIGVQDVTSRHYVGGRVHGLWDGTGGVTLQLEAEGVNTLLSVSASGDFHFGDSLVSGTSYAVTVMTSPTQHTCIVDGGDKGVVADADVTSVSIGCTGLAISIALSGPWGWTFDPAQEMQTFAGSIAMQDVVLTVSGSELTSASVNGVEATLGQPTPALALPLGTSMVPVAVTARSGLSKTYQLVFDRGGAVLQQAVYGKASNAGAGDNFGVAVALSGDTLAVGARAEDSGATGVNPAGGQADNDANQAGAVYVFVRAGTTWTQQAYLKASNAGAGDFFGLAVALSGDTLAVGAWDEASGATGVNPAGGQADNSADRAGAVYVFVRTGTTWTQQAYLKASNTDANDFFGFAGPPGSTQPAVRPTTAQVCLARSTCSVDGATPRPLPYPHDATEEAEEASTERRPHLWARPVPSTHPAMHSSSDARMARAHGGAIVASAILFLTTPGEREQATARIIPIIHDRGTGLAIIGRF